uniref:Uncharacterized protein n=1 Tax=Setaria italica TaxID=4555 RepID=K3YFD7_SETIT
MAGQGRAPCSARSAVTKGCSLALQVLAPSESSVQGCREAIEMRLTLTSRPRLVS